MRLFFIIALMLSNIVFAKADDQLGYGRLVGSFSGSVRGQTSGETVFYTDQSGVLQGIYFIHDGAYTKMGYLKKLTLCCGGVLTGEWEDNGQVGDVVFYFQNPEFTEFEGRWGTDHSIENGGAWLGKK